MSDDEGGEFEFEEDKYGETYEGGRVGFEAPLRLKDAQSISSYNLYKTLEKYPDFTKDARNTIKDEFAKFPDLPVLNLETLASVINFLKDVPNPTPEDFTDENILPYFARLIPDKPMSSEERKRTLIRLKAQFLIYIRAVRTFRENQ